MNSDTPSFKQQQAERQRRRNILAQMLKRDETSLVILVMAAFVGMLTGLVAVAFDKTVTLITNFRMGTLAQVADNAWLVWPLAFVLSALLAVAGFYLVLRIAPEAGGSGIPEIEGALEEMRPVRWRRVLPVKFFGGLGTLGAGMVLGREGPTVQIGGNIGRMVTDIFRTRDAEARHTLLATGAAAGLAAAFNAPLAGIFFIIEEMRAQFHYNLISIKAVFTGVIMSTIMYRVFNDDTTLIDVGQLNNAPLNTLWLYLVLGIVFGCLGPLFNSLVLHLQAWFQRLRGEHPRRWLLVGGMIGGGCGVFALLAPSLVGGGFSLVPIATAGNYALGALLFIFVLRAVTTLLCFCSGAPGGIFAPMLALGTVLGMAFGMLCAALFPHYQLDGATFAIAGMGALLAASVRAPLTGIVLVLEMTDNYQLILPMIITCLGATLLAQFLGGKPLYSAILERTLARQDAMGESKPRRENT